MRGGGDVIFLATRPPPRGSAPARIRPRGRGRGAPRGSRRGDDRSPKGRRRWDARRGARARRASPRRATGTSPPLRRGRASPRVVPVRARRRRRAGHVGGRAECHGGHFAISGACERPTSVLSTAGPGERRFASSTLSEHGARRAVFVGVNYAPFVSGGEKHRRRASSSVRLRHRGDDCRWMLETLAPAVRRPGRRAPLVDDGHEDGQPTWANITRAMAWLTRRAQPGDSLAFHFSGRTDLRREDDASGREGEKNATKKAPDGLTATTRSVRPLSRTTASFEPTPRFYRATGKKRARSRARSCTRVW